MKNINTENGMTIMLVAQEILETTGQLWITLGDEEYYIPELIVQLKTLLKYSQAND